jgi:hypothetical protein
MFYASSMTLLPLQATHHTSTSDTLLDLIAVADRKAVVSHGQIPFPALSGHDLIYLVYGLRSPRQMPKIITYRDYKNINFHALFGEASNLNWQCIYATNDVNVMVRELNYGLKYLFEKYVPLVERRVTRDPAPWITDGIRQLMRERDRRCKIARRTKNAIDFENYRQLRNYCKQTIRNAKSRYHHELITSARSSSVMWRRLRDIGVGREKGGSEVSHTLDELNDFFAGIPVGLDRARDYFDSLPPCVSPELFHFSAVSQHDVLSAINKIKSNAAGVDGLSLKFLKIMLPIILPFITHIINTSLLTSVFPDDWKFSIVIPLNKIPNPTSPSDYRPISLLVVLSKVLEIIVHLQMNSFILRERLVSDFQSGFRVGHSTTSALLRVTDDIRRAMDCRKLTIMVLVDFSKAFDSIYHPILLYRLRSLGFSNSTVAWVRSYLQNRCQCVRLGGSSSRWRPVGGGVPQGSVLGPLLFSIYINDLTNVLNTTRHHLYADDLQLYRHFNLSNFDLAISEMNAELTRVVEWTQCNGLKINENKSQAMILGYSRLLNNLNHNRADGPFITINDKQLDFQTTVKNLGLSLSNTLDWTDHVNSTCNRAIGGINSLKKISHLLPLSTKIMLVKTLIFPIFSYCDLVTIDMTVQLTEKLQRAQNYCVRFIFNLQRDEHISPYYERLNLLKLHESRCLRALMFLYRLLRTGSPDYLAAGFRFLSDVGRGGTRHGSHLLAVPVHRTVMFNKSFQVTVSRLWNSLPVDVKSLDSERRFSAAVAAWIGGGGLGGA